MRDIFSVSLCCCVCIFAVSASDLSITRETERDADTARLRHLSWIAVLCRCVCIARVAVSLCLHRTCRCVCIASLCHMGHCVPCDTLCHMSASYLSVTWDTARRNTDTATQRHNCVACDDDTDARCRRKMHLDAMQTQRHSDTATQRHSDTVSSPMCYDAARRDTDTVTWDTASLYAIQTLSHGTQHLCMRYRHCHMEHSIS